MPVYTNTYFRGHWPVGTAAVVTANSPERAAKLLETELDRIGLGQPVEPEEMILFESNQESVAILRDGDY